MKSLKLITATLLIVVAAQVSFARTGTISVGRTGTITVGRTGTISVGRTGTISVGRTTTHTSEGIIPTQSSNQRFRSIVQDEMLFNLLFWLNISIW